MDAHVGFKNGKWQNEICVKDFIAQNYVPYQGDGTFLADATPRTKKARKKMEELFLAERNKGGVLDVDVDTVSTITAFKPGYLLGDEDIIVGFQTDAPLKELSIHLVDCVWLLIVARRMGMKSIQKFCKSSNIRQRTMTAFFVLIQTKCVLCENLV